MLKPSTGEPSFLGQIPHLDKVVHFTLFCVWGSLGYRAFGASQSTVKLWSVAVVAIVCLAAGTEWLQRYVEGRQDDVLDFVADMSGGLLGVCLTKYWKIN
ncbi:MULTISPECIES: VanZ family protein [Reichenbachiella]|uniref:VanZ family protein n=1 Tax=Reichenbachiella TaxID=156993 RepID=UPI001314BCB7|nr:MULTISPECIES: VanZ family protein [Reichenbachiella]MBU2915534.1 VanZ family protein [Reichenbachiella agariperforans]